MDDSFLFGQVIGIALGSGAVAFFAARDHFRKRRARGDMSREAKRRSKIAPALIAVATGAACGILAFGFFTSQKVWSETEARPIEAPPSRPELMSNFVRGCMEGCLKNSEQPVCQAYCTCTSAEVDRRLGNAKQLATSELLAAAELCEQQVGLERQ